MAIIADGKILARQKQQQLKTVVASLARQSITPKLVWISIGDTPENQLYGHVKQKAASQLGIDFHNLTITTADQLQQLPEQIQTFNQDSTIHGIIVQLPALIENQRLDANQLITILSLINPYKDVDCLTPTNLGKLMIGAPVFLPATVASVNHLLNDATSQLYQAKLQDWLPGKRVTVIGGGLEIGKPLVSFLSNQGATVLWARSTEQALLDITQNADVIVSATGKSNLINADMIKADSILIDVSSPQADFDFRSVETKAAYITPVPGGVGPLTVASLMEHVIAAAQMRLL